MTGPRIIVYSSVFPSSAAPTAGTFIRERMFRVARRVPLAVVAPQPWSPFDALLRRIRPAFRPVRAAFEVMDGVEVHRPRFLSVPGVLKRFDGLLMAWSTWSCVRDLHARFHATLVDAHFGYPDGFAAAWIARRLHLPMTLTIRGSKDQRLIGTSREPGLRFALSSARRLISVSESLVRDVGLPLGIQADRFSVIGNGVDLERFRPEDRDAARRRLGIDSDARVVIGVGNLIELKGFHRVIPLLRGLRARHPKLLYLIVGGGAGQGDMSARLLALARENGVADAVRLCGRQPQDELRWFYSAADVFALATEYEGWANVLLEAMACGLPVVTTRVGGNDQVVRDPGTGTLVDYWDADAFAAALDDALGRAWSRDRILDYARANSWDARVDALLDLFAEVDREGTRAERPRLAVTPTQGT